MAYHDLTSAATILSVDVGAFATSHAPSLTFPHLCCSGTAGKRVVTVDKRAGKVVASWDNQAMLSAVSVEQGEELLTGDHAGHIQRWDVSGGTGPPPPLPHCRLALIGIELNPGPSTPPLTSACRICHRAVAHPDTEWRDCYVSLHRRLFEKIIASASSSSSSPSSSLSAQPEIIELKVPDIEYYPTCRQLGCESSEREDHACRFHVVMTPAVLQGHSGKISVSNQHCMGQEPRVIIQPQVSAQQHADAVGSLRTPHMLAVIHGGITSKASHRKSFPCVFRYVRLTGRPRPQVMNAALRLQHADVKIGIGRVLVLVGLLDKDTVKWIRGTRLSATKVPSLTILLHLFTPSGKDWLMCIYDGLDSKLFDTAKFNFVTKPRFFTDSDPVKSTLDLHFSMAAKKLRESGDIDQLWGQPNITDNILFSLPADYLYVNFHKLQKRDESLRNICDKPAFLAEHETRLAIREARPLPAVLRTSPPQSQSGRSVLPPS